MGTEIYCRSIDRRWRNEVASLADRVVIMSPYLTPQTALSVLCNAEPGSCEVYTTFSVQNFAAGASCLKTVRMLLEAKYSLFEIDRLHAKVVLAAGRFVSIGSQNLTSRGTRNREATVAFDDPTIVEMVEEQLAPWIASRRPITLEMVDALDEELDFLRREYRRIQRLADSLESPIRAEEAERIRLETERQREIEERRLQLIKEAQAKQQAARSRIRQARSNLQLLLPNGRVPLGLAKEFVRRSAWWLTHVSGPVRAPRHADRIRGPEGDWRVDFGANAFMVGRAIQRCVQEVERCLARIERGERVTRGELVEALKMTLRGAVANYEGEEYAGYYSAIQGNDMVFGAQSIDMQNFIEHLLSKTSLTGLVE